MENKLSKQRWDVDLSNRAELKRDLIAAAKAANDAIRAARLAETSRQTESSRLLDSRESSLDSTIPIQFVDLESERGKAIRAHERKRVKWSKLPEQNTNQNSDYSSTGNSRTWMFLFWCSFQLLIILALSYKIVIYYSETADNSSPKLHNDAANLHVKPMSLAKPPVINVSITTSSPSLSSDLLLVNVLFRHGDRKYALQSFSYSN